MTRALDPNQMSCPICEYPIPHETALCPECGFVATEEELAARVRRFYFLEFSGAGIGYAIVLTLVASLMVPYFYPIPIVLLSVAVTPLIARSAPKGYRVLLRRAWLISTPWLFLPWFIPWAFYRAIEWFFAGTYSFGNIFRSSHLPGYLRVGAPGAYGEAVYAVALLVMIFGLHFLWQRRWRVLCAQAAIPEEYRLSVVASIWSRVVFAPAFLLALVSAGLGTLKVLDMISPGWDR
jgi:hypothetical protein